MVSLVEAEISQCISFPVGGVVCLLDNSTNNVLAAKRLCVYQYETKQASEGKCGAMMITMMMMMMMFVMSLDIFVCVAWMLVFSINVAKL